MRVEAGLSRPSPVGGVDVCCQRDRSVLDTSDEIVKACCSDGSGGVPVGVGGHHPRSVPARGELSSG